MSLSEARFHDLVDATQQAVEDIFDDSGLDVDLENSAGVLTVRFDNGSQLIKMLVGTLFQNSNEECASQGSRVQ